MGPEVEVVGLADCVVAGSGCSSCGHRVAEPRAVVGWPLFAQLLAEAAL